MRIISKILCMLLLVYCINYIVDRFKNKKQDIGLDNTMVICAIALILIIILG